MLPVALLGVVGVFVQAPGATAATPPTPSYGTAVVDGNSGDWSLANDLYGSLYEAGNASKPVLADGYLRYDCSSQTMYVLVLQEGAGTPDAVPVLTQADDAWVKVGTYPNVNPSPVVTGASGTNAGGTPPEFSWVGLGYDSNPATRRVTRRRSRSQPTRRALTTRSSSTPAPSWAGRRRPPSSGSRKEGCRSTRSAGPSRRRRPRW
jgi:hypothetical protein